MGRHHDARIRMGHGSSACSSIGHAGPATGIRMGRDRWRPGLGMGHSDDPRIRKHESARMRWGIICCTHTTCVDGAWNSDGVDSFRVLEELSVVPISLQV